MGGAAAQTSLDLSELLRGYHEAAGLLFPAWHGQCFPVTRGGEALWAARGFYVVLLFFLFLMKARNGHELTQL